MTKLQSYAVKAGILIGLAFFIVRLSMARTSRDLMLAAGGTAIEIAVVLFLERKAKELEPRISDYTAKRQAARTAEADLEAGIQEQTFRQGLVTETEQARKATEREREMNAALSNEQKLITVAVNASNGGYADGLVERRALIHSKLRNNDQERHTATKGAAA